MNSAATRPRAIARNQGKLWIALVLVTIILSLLLWKQILPLSIASSFLTLIGAILAIATKTDAEHEGKRKLTTWGRVLIVVTIVAGTTSALSTFFDDRQKASAERDRKQNEQRSAKDIGDIRVSQQDAKHDAQAAKDDLHKEIKISQGLEAELEFVRRELELERVPVNSVTVTWVASLPIDEPCVRAYVEEAQKQPPHDNQIRAAPSSLKLSIACQEEVTHILSSQSLSVAFTPKGLKQLVWPLAIVPIHGTHGATYVGAVPEGIWEFSVSDRPLDAKNYIVVNPETDQIYLGFHRQPLPEGDLRDPTGKRLSMLDISEGTFVFLPVTDGEPIIRPHLEHIELVLNNWELRFGEPRWDHGLTPDRRFQETYGSGARNYFVVKAPKFRH